SQEMLNIAGLKCQDDGRRTKASSGRLCSSIDRSGCPASLLDTSLDELDPLQHAQPLRLGLFAATFALVDSDLDLLAKAQADIVRDGRGAHGGLVGIGGWTITGCSCGLLQALDVVRAQLGPVDVQRELVDLAGKDERRLIVVVIDRRAGVGSDV